MLGACHCGCILHRLGYDGATSDEVSFRPAEHLTQHVPLRAQDALIEGWAADTEIDVPVENCVVRAFCCGEEIVRHCTDALGRFSIITMRPRRDILLVASAPLYDNIVITYWSVAATW